MGTGKTVTLTGATLTGTDAGNYTLTSVGTTTAEIATKVITGSFTAANKLYDGTSAATITGRSLVGVVSGDDVSLVGGAATFANAAVGLGKTVTGTGFSLSGVDAANYSLASSTLTTTADITYRWDGFLQPINDTAHLPACHESKFKLGQTIPAKFEIKDAAGQRGPAGRQPDVRTIGLPRCLRYSGYYGKCSVHQSRHSRRVPS